MHLAYVAGGWRRCVWRLLWSASDDMVKSWSVVVGSASMDVPKRHAVGVDLAWGDSRASGLALFVGPVPGQPGSWRLIEQRTARSIETIADWIASRVPQDAPCQVAVDAPLVANNAEGTQRSAERAMAPLLRAHRLGLFPVDQRHAVRGSELLGRLEKQGFAYSVPVADGGAYRGVFETFPTAAQLSLFELRRPIRYKHGAVDVRRERLRSAQLRLAMLDDAAIPIEETSAWRDLVRARPDALRGGQLKDLEDRFDATLAGLVAILAWTAPGRLLVTGNVAQGFIAIPHPPA